MSGQNKSKDRLVRGLSIAVGILILCSTIINATSPSPRSLLWVFGESLGFSGAIVIFVAILSWAKPSKQETHSSVV
jgi:hypothetical protein